MAMERPYARGDRMFDIRFKTWDEWSYPSTIATLETMHLEDSGGERKAMIYDH